MSAVMALRKRRKDEYQDVARGARYRRMCERQALRGPYPQPKTVKPMQ